MSKPSTMHINANFDVAQTSSKLECKFKRSDAKGVPITGRNAGSLVFAQGEEVFVQVNAGGVQLLGAPRPFAAFRVVDCTFASRPRVYICGPNQKKVIFAPPSLFDWIQISEQDPIQVEGATVVLPAAGFEKAPVDDTPPGYFQEGKAWKGKLIVGQTKARWLLTLMVTVEIDYGDGSAPEMRVMEIDPETEVDNGSGGPPPMEEPEGLALACAIDPETEVDNGSGGPPPRMA